MFEKKIDKRRSIGLASKEVGLESYILRFWEKEFPQLKPNVGKGSRRYYYDKDIENIFKIKYFLYDLGYTIKGLKSLLIENNGILKKTLDDIKKMTKIIREKDINKDNITKNVNELISIQTKLKDFVKRFNEFNF